MAPSFEDFIQSQQFTFFVGQVGKPFVVHSAAIAATSKQLDALINGGMGEAATRCARIEDVEVDDFIRFCEYAYRGDYTTPLWEVIVQEQKQESKLESKQEPKQESKQEPKQQPEREPNPQSINYETIDGDTWGASMSRVKKKGRKAYLKVATDDYGDLPPEPEPEAELTPVEAEPVYETTLTSRVSLRTQLKRRTYLSNENPKAQILEQFEHKPNTTADQNFTPVLLAHARLYCFAHLRLIEPLKELTLDKLHKTLMTFKLFTARVGDIIELARFAYSNADLPDRKDDGTIDDLKKLVVEYVVCEIDTIGKCDEFVKYVEEGGEFVGDFWRMARGYVV